jgi:sugar phosphate isomerase/epimerase
MKRRSFVKMSSAAIIASQVEALPSFPKVETQSKVIIFATNWGYGGTFDEFCKKIKAEGYDGAEIWYNTDKKQRDEAFNAFTKYGLKLGFLTGAWGNTPQEHAANFLKTLEEAATQKDFVPSFINCHSGSDVYSFEENKVMLDGAIKIAKQTKLPIHHETHRGRMLYNGPVTKRFIDALPELSLTLDISHWTVVHESLLESQPENVAAALSRTSHIHSRVGHPEGPQVSDPRAPEWAPALKKHIEWWDTVAKNLKSKNQDLTITTEFGPPDYMPTTAYTRQPLADQWSINVHMLNMLRERYK